MSRPTDVRVVGAAVFLIPVRTRMPLKFGAQIVDSVTCGRVAVEVEDAAGRRAVGWGETPLSVQWGWPSAEPHVPRERAMIRLTESCAAALVDFPEKGHALEIGHAFRHAALDRLAAAAHEPGLAEQIPELAALICLSPFDLALHDAFGTLHGLDIYATYGRDFLTRDLGELYGRPEERRRFQGRYPAEFLVKEPPTSLQAWHLIGGLDPLAPDELRGDEPKDGHPVLLGDWIDRDGLDSLKVKLRGNDLAWDIDRLVRAGTIGMEHGVKNFCADFNCTVTDPAYVHAALDAVADRLPAFTGLLRYVEQPFPYDLIASPIDVHSISARTLLLLDESAHDWTHVARGRDLGWNGVALKTCKTQSGALLSLCWAREQGMAIMVQDLTNPMLAVIPHLRLAAHAGTFAGVETNASQFYPEASLPEAAIHPGMYRRREGKVRLDSLRGPGFGMRVAEIARQLPPPSAAAGTLADAGAASGLGSARERT